jgi:hypothetical protein
MTYLRYFRCGLREAAQSKSIDKNGPLTSIGSPKYLKKLASQIARQLQGGDWMHCAIYEQELQRLWPLNQKDREAKIAQFANEYGFRLRFYRKGLCAIFDKWPRGRGRTRADVKRGRGVPQAGRPFALKVASQWQTYFLSIALKST